MTAARCAHCPVADDLRCRGGGFCDWAAAGDPVHLRHIAAVALRDVGRPMPAQPAVPCPDAAAPSPEGVPCCGGQPPGLLTKAANFTSAVVSHVAAGRPAADAATVAARWATCRACPMFDAPGVTCRACGCHLEIKIRWAEQVCPLGKW